jgi:hypothetical protein
LVGAAVYTTIATDVKVSPALSMIRISATSAAPSTG